MDPEALKQKEIFDSWLEIADALPDGDTKAVVKHFLKNINFDAFEGYDIGRILDEAYDELREPEPEPDPYEHFMEFVCIDAAGIEDGFDEGTTYLAESHDDGDYLWVVDRNGVKREVFRERFKIPQGGV